MVKKGVRKNKKSGIVLVLGSGGAKGFAHIGVIEELQKNNIPIKAVIGASAGALVGGFYCADRLKDLKKIVLDVDKIKNIELLFASLNEDIINPIKEDLGKIKIEKLKTPFIALSYDLLNNRKVLIKNGNLFKAVRASIALPFVFQPVKTKNSLLFDGGIADSLPVDIAFKKFSKHKVIAVDVCSSQKPLGEKLFNNFNRLSWRIKHPFKKIPAKLNIHADLIISPDVRDIEPLEFYKSKKSINRGRIAVRKMLPQIKKLLEYD